jgi:hypothetical protein
MLIGWEEYNYFINCTAVQLMIFPKQTKWRKGILNTNVKWNCPRGSEYVRVHISRLIHIDDVDVNPVMSSEDNTVEPLLNGHPRGRLCGRLIEVAAK